MNPQPKSVAVTIKRGAPGVESHETFDVPYREGMSVLDAVVWIRTNVDPQSRFVIAVSMPTPARNVWSLAMAKRSMPVQRGYQRDTTVGPLTNKTLIHDLVTDIVPPKENLCNFAARDEGRVSIMFAVFFNHMHRHI